VGRRPQPAQQLEQPRDLITGLDGSGVSSPSALMDLLLERHPGDRVTVNWQAQEGGRHTATITLASGPPQ